MKTTFLFRPFWSGNQRPNRRRLTVESMEDRLALSPTLPLPPPSPPGAVVYFHPHQSYAPAPSSLPQVPILPPQPIHPPNPC